MARNYIYNDDKIYSHFLDYPDGILAPNGTLTEPSDLKTNKWKFDEINETWNEILLEERLQMIIKEKSTLVHNSRDEIITNGFYYTFSNGDTSLIQTRDVNDLIAIIGTVVSSLVMINQGITEIKIPFRCANDETHLMTPAETIQLGMEAQMFISEVYQKSWNIKEQLKACTTVEELENINTEIVMD